MAITKTGKALIIGGAVWTALAIGTAPGLFDAARLAEAASINPARLAGELTATFIGLVVLVFGFTLKKKTPQTQTQ